MKWIIALLGMILLAAPAFAANCSSFGYANSAQIHVSGLSDYVPDQVITVMLNSSFDYVNTHNNLSDIRFYSESNATEYRYWRDFVNLTGYSYIYVQIPNLSGAVGGTQKFYMCYNKPAAVTGENNSIFFFYKNCSNLDGWNAYDETGGMTYSDSNKYLPDPRGENKACYSYNNGNAYGEGYSYVTIPDMHHFAFDFWGMKDTYENTESYFGMRGMYLSLGDSANIGIGSYGYVCERKESSLAINATGICLNGSTSLWYREGEGTTAINKEWLRDVFLINYTNDTMSEIYARYNISTDSIANTVQNIGGSKGGYDAINTIDVVSVSAPAAEQSEAWWDEIKMYNATYPFPNVALTGLKAEAVDTTPPVVTAILPLNTTYPQYFDLNFTASDDVAIDQCWYSFGVTNITLTSCSNTTTGLTSGTYTITYYVNDTSGNIGNSTPVTFTIDADAPVLNITYPAALQVLATKDTAINWTTNEPLSYCEYSVNANPYAPLSCNITSIPLSGMLNGTYNVYIRIYDLVNNSIAAGVSFYVQVPLEISIISPANTSYLIFTNISLNVSITAGNGLDTCWYIMDAEAPVYNCLNVILSPDENPHTLAVHANDTIGNSVSSSVSFTVYSPPPPPPTPTEIVLSILAIIIAMAIISAIVYLPSKLNLRTADDWISYIIVVMIMLALLGVVVLFMAVL